MRVSVLSFVVLSSCLPAMAAETEWHELAPDVSVRLISTGTVDWANTTTMALELAMPQTTKTYWRVPGETGLPLEADFARSIGVADHTVLWPHPVREVKAGYLDYVYFGDTVLPIEVEVSDASGQVDIDFVLGVCSDICVPAQTRLSLPLVDAQPDRANGLRIRQALAEVPQEWTGPGEPFGTAQAIADDVLAIELIDPAMDVETLIAATDDGDPLFGVPQKSPQGDLVLLPILAKSDDSAIDGQDIDLHFMTDQGAFVLHREVETGRVSAAR